VIHTRTEALFAWIAQSVPKDSIRLPPRIDPEDIEKTAEMFEGLLSRLPVEIRAALIQLESDGAGYVIAAVRALSARPCKEPEAADEVETVPHDAVREAAVEA
jgi:hypothetical protein